MLAGAKHGAVDHEFFFDGLCHCEGVLSREFAVGVGALSLGHEQQVESLLKGSVGWCVETEGWVFDVALYFGGQ